MTERWSSKADRSYPARRGSPPDEAFFVAERPAAGGEEVALAFDDLRLEIAGLDVETAELLLRRYGPYAASGPAALPPALRVRFAHEATDYFIDPPASPEFNPVWIAVEGTRVRYVGYTLAGRFDLATGDAVALLARGLYEPPDRALENFIRCATAWCAASGGGALVHGASAVRNRRAYLFFGESGAGKSTLSASTTRATIVSDDLTLVLPAASGGLDVVGSPFRGTYEEGAPVLGRFPLAAAFRIVKAESAVVREVPRAVAFGQLIGSLTFVAEAFGERPDLFASIERAFAPVPLRHLEFRKDDSYWDAIDAAGL